MKKIKISILSIISIVLILAPILAIDILVDKGFLCDKDCADVLGGALGYYGTIILGIVTTSITILHKYDDDVRYKKSIKPDLYISFKSLRLMEIFRYDEEYYKITVLKHKDLRIEKTYPIPKDIIALRNKYNDMTYGRSKTEKEDEFYNYHKKLREKYLLLECRFDNFGNGNIIQFNVNIDNHNVEFLPKKIDSNRGLSFLLLIKNTNNKEDIKINVLATYKDMDEKLLTKNKQIILTKENNKRLYFNESNNSKEKNNE